MMMTARIANLFCRKLRSLGREDDGAALVITMGVFFFLVILVSSVYALGMTVQKRIELQNACDTAAYAAAVVQADGLSRMATVNRALSWTYVQMVRRQMDYITYKWLKLTCKRFKEDRDKAESYYFHLFDCDKKHADGAGHGWWCGQGPSNHNKLRLNMGSDYPKYDDLKKVVDKLKGSYGDNGEKLGEQIDQDKEMVENLNFCYTVINTNMMLGMQEAARSMLELNLPKGADGKVSPDFYYVIHTPVAADPYDESQGQGALGVDQRNCFSPLYNTEEHEALFLTMGADGHAAENIGEYFGSGTNGSGGVMDKIAGGLGSFFGGGNSKRAPGLDHWFVRTYPEESRIDNKKTIKPTADTYYHAGISRSYKNANRDEGRSLLGYHRGNHITWLEEPQVAGGENLLGFLTEIINGVLDSIKDVADITPSCQNERSKFPEMCAEVGESIGLVSQYRWASAKWFCFFTVSIIPPKIIWHHPFIPKFDCEKHGYGEWLGWIGPQLGEIFGFEGMSRKEYRSCYMGLDTAFILKGLARIYGDDREIYDDRYEGVWARPWVLNQNFFNGDGTITVGLARRATNPWTSFLRKVEEWADQNAANPRRGLMSVFNVTEDNYMWTASAARAAYRRAADGEGYAYEVVYDKIAYPETLAINYASGASGDMKKLRIGCIHKDHSNQERLEKSWNLWTPEWDATLLPVRYARAQHSEYDSLQGGAPVWNEAPLELFQTLSELEWNSFDGASRPGVRLMESRSIDNGERFRGKHLQNWRQLEQLKIN